MENFEEISEKLTHNGEYAVDVVLLLYLSEAYSSLHYLDYLDITGKDLETLAHKCLPEYNLDYLVKTIRFLRSGFLGMDEIIDNLHSLNPVPFIKEKPINSNDWDYIYEDYAGTFRENLKKNKGR